MTGKHEEGEQMREIPLAERFQVSRGPVRDALLQLTQEGLLRAQPNRGARVAGVWNSEIRPAMVKIRLQLESTAVRALIKEGRGHDLRPFKTNLRHFAIACEDNDLPSVVQLDMAFHRLILRQCGHAGLETVWLPIMAGMRLPYSRHKSLLKSYEEHKSIVDSIADGRIRRALDTLKTNIH
jgi:DNA-binding GntR family transcriptional regulator